MASLEEKVRGNIVSDRRPWGGFKRYVLNEVCTVKIITVNPGQILSKQRHFNRDELWVVLDPGLRIELGDRIIEAAPGEEVFIPRLAWHRLSCTGSAPGRVMEISLGAFDEDDIERTEDMYGRK